MKKTVLLISIFIYQISIACSAFYFNGENKIFAKNFDWGFGQGYLIKNIRGQQKYAYGFRGNNVAGWTSKFGSITFNQNGKEFPYGGINEKGLVVEQLWLGNTEYQENNNKTISELEWIQYQLDNYENVDEVIKNINSLTIKPIARIHYFLADKNGVSAVIDFVNGDVKIDRKQDKFQVITNETSEDSKKYYDFNKDINPNSRSHFDRYCILRNNLNVENLSISESFKKLNLVKEDEPNYKSYWSIVYDINKLEFYFKSVDNSEIKKVSLKDFSFHSNSNTEFSLINSNKVNFQPYSSNDNLRLLTNAIEMMRIEINIEKGNQHQMNPNEIRVDEVFQSKYSDLLIEFVTKKVKGNIWFTVIKEEDNFKNYKGFISGILPVKSNVNRKMLYVFPRGEFAVACFQDTDSNSKIDKNFLGIPINTGFSNNKRKFFGIPPNYKSALISDQPKFLKIIVN
jgi:choloylglycine hydrolase